MTQISKEAYALVRKVLAILDYSNEDQEEEVVHFEETLLKTFLEAITKKLPEQERKPMVELANAAVENKERKRELKEKLHHWYNEQEVKELFEKVSTKLFNELLRNAYQRASEAQKKKIEEMFKKEALQ